MWQLHVPAPEFVAAALGAGKKARFEGAVLLLTRNLATRWKTELMERWGELDDVTHNDILVLSFGLGREASGVPAYRIQRHVVAEGISADYPWSETFSKHFEELLRVADHVPELPASLAKIDTRGSTDLRRFLEINEAQLPALLLFAYRKRKHFVVELDSGTEQISPAQFLLQLARNLGDLPYKSKAAQDLSERSSELWWQIWKANDKLRQHLSNISQFESVAIHVHEVFAGAPPEIKAKSEKMMAFLTGGDADLETILAHKRDMNSYVWSRTTTPMSRRLPKKLSKAIGARIRRQLPPNTDWGEAASRAWLDARTRLQSKIDVLKRKREDMSRRSDQLWAELKSADLENALSDAIERTAEDFGLKQSSKGTEMSFLLNGERYEKQVYSPAKEGEVVRDYDIALSFAGEDRSFVEAVARELIQNEIRVFYDRYESATLWGKNLYEYLDEIYRERATLCVLFLSKAYRERLWTNHERRSAQARAFRERREYILPVRLDGTEIPGIPETIAYIDGTVTSPSQISALVIEKLQQLQSSSR
jgi:hypothetical protein